LADTEATQASTATGRPAAASTSSTPPEPSQPADPVAALGERILAELGADHSNSTLTRWLAHHTAALLQAADQATSTGAADANARAANARAAILELWQHRSAWPSGWPPRRAAEIAQILETLPDLDDLPWNRSTILTRLHDLHYHILAVLIDVATRDDENIEQGWLKAFGDQLTPDEIALLAHAATTEQRLGQLQRWWDRTRVEPAIDDAAIEGAGDDAGAAKSTTTDIQPLVALADAYRQTILDLLDRRSEDGGDADAPADHAPTTQQDEIQ
jgi:hypothetical protein